MGIGFESFTSKDDLASQYANVPRNKEVKEAIESNISGASLSLDQILSGNTTSLGEEVINPYVIESAKNGDQNSLDVLSQKVNTYNRKIQMKPPIANVVMSADFMPTIKAPPENLNKEQKNVFKEYQENRVNIYNALNGAKGSNGRPLFRDQRVKNLLTKYFSSGEFFEETGRQVLELPRAIGSLPVLADMAWNAVGASIDAVGEETYTDSWKKRQPEMAYNSVMWTDWFKKNVGNLTFGNSVNDKIKKRYLEENSEDDYNKSYKPVMADGKVMELPMINDEQGEWLLKYGFQTLPYEQKFSERLLEGIGFTGMFSKLALRKGAKDQKLVGELRKSEPKIYKSTMSDIDVLREHKLQKSFSNLTRSWNKFTGTVGRKFGATGAVGAANINKEYSQAMKASHEAISNKRKEIRLAKKNKVNQVEIDTLNGELQNLQNVNNTLWIKSLGTGDRYTIATLGSEIPLAAMQATGEHFHQKLGVSQDLGGFMGVLAYATGSYKLITKPLGIAGSFLAGKTGFTGIAQDTGRLIEDIASLPFDMPVAGINKILGKDYKSPSFRGLFVDRRFDELEKLHTSSFGKGRPLTSGEKESFKKLSLLMKDMSAEQRELAFKSIQEYREIRGKLVNAFPEGAAREEAAEIFQLSFAHASGLAPLQALDRLQAAKIDPSNPDLEKLADLQIQAENTVSIAEKGISRLLEMLKNPQTKFDPTRNAAALNMIQNFKKAVDGQQLIIMERKQGLLDLTRDYVIKTLNDPLAPIDENTISKIHNTNLLLNKNLVDNPKQAQESLLSTITDVRKALGERAKQIESFRGTDEYKFRMGKLVEDMYDVQIESNYELGKSFYTKAERIAANQPPLDVSDIVEKMVLMTDDLDASDLGYFFSPKSRFFNSRAGRMTKKAFDRMGRRSLEKSGMTDEYIDELKGFFSLPGDNYIGENPSLIEIALRMNKKGIQMADGTVKKTNINPFQASPFELEEMRRFFVGIAERSTDKDLKGQYNKFIKTIDDAVGLNPTLDQAIQEARNNYKRVIFDPSRKGSVGYKINTSREGPERTDPNPNQYRYTYEEDFKPENFHQDISQSVFDLLENRGTNPGRKLKEKINDLVYYWGDKEESGQLIFDLTTDNGKAKFQNIQDLLKMQFYEHWGMMRENLVSQIGKKLDDPDFDLLKTPILSDRNFDNAKKLRKLEDEGVFKVQVKRLNQETGEIETTEISMLSMDEIIAADNDIDYVLELSSSARKQYQNLARELNDASSDVNVQAKTALDIQEKSVETFQKLSSYAEDPAMFFEKVIAKGNKDSVSILKERYLVLRKAELGYNDLSASEIIKKENMLEAEFDEGMRHFIINGLLERAGTKRSSTIKIKNLDGTTDRGHREISNAAQFATDIRNEDTQEILEMFLEKDHMDYLNNFSDFLEFAAGASQLRYTPSGVIRSISPNELISRAFNLARGMVSPTYVAAELGVRIAAQNGIELVGLALENKQAAEIMGRMLDAPETLNLDDVKNLGVLIKSYVARQLTMRGNPAIEGNYMSKSEKQKYQSQSSAELLEQLPEKGNFFNKQINQLTAL
tara:strand:- start:56 stop:4735 length:4680 start_codon:yes stop_codon:yes gene_type:complete